MSLFLLRMTMLFCANHVCSKDETGRPTPLMTQVLRHFSLDAKLGLTDVQVNEVWGIITPSHTFKCKSDLGSSVSAFHAICVNAQLSET